jgi:hypothetical protein
MKNFELENVRPSVEDSPIAVEIIEMARVDQDMRLNLSPERSWDFSIDQKNTARMKEIINDIGWPTISKVGKLASYKAWLLVQHADHDPKFQAECLELLKNTEPSDVDVRNIAYLEDRVRVNTGRPILYGTQFYNDGNGNFGPREIEDIENLDKRREQMGLESFEEYENNMNENNKKREERNKK